MMADKDFMSGLFAFQVTRVGIAGGLGRRDAFLRVCCSVAPVVSVRAAFLIRAKAAARSGRTIAL